MELTLKDVIWGIEIQMNTSQFSDSRGDSTPPLLSNPPETQALRWSNLKCHHIRKVVDVTDFWLVGVGIINELHSCQSGRSSHSKPVRDNGLLWYLKTNSR